MSPIKEKINKPQVTDKDSLEYNLCIMVAALDQTDQNLAIELVSDPCLDPKELSILITVFFRKSIVNKDTGEPLQLSKPVMMALLKNKLNQTIKHIENNG